MRRPPPSLASWTLIGGALLLALSAALQVVLFNSQDDGNDDVLVFLTLILQGLATAAGLVIAAGMVMAAWSFAADRAGRTSPSDGS